MIVDLGTNSVIAYMRGEREGEKILHLYRGDIIMEKIGQKSKKKREKMFAKDIGEYFDDEKSVTLTF